MMVEGRVIEDAKRAYRLRLDGEIEKLGISEDEFCKAYRTGRVDGYVSGVTEGAKGMIAFWEFRRKEIRSLLKACLYHPDMSDPEGWLRKAIDLIEQVEQQKEGEGI